MDELVELLQNVNCLETEKDIVYKTLEKQRYTYEDVKESITRYNRYLDGISIWQIGDKNFTYIKENLETYLNNIHKMELKEIIKAMITIDLMIKNDIIERE